MEHTADDAIARRIAEVPPSATMAVTARARELRAAGVDVIGFGAGEPDFPTPAHIVEAAAAACHDPINHRYSPAAGLPELREAVTEVARRDAGLVVDPAQVVVTNGGKQAVYNTFQVLLDPGDEVIVPAPYWVTYPEAVRLAGGVPVIVPTGLDTGFKVTVPMLEAARTDRTKMLVIVSPSNPTGAVYDAEELEAIGRWALANDVWILSDDIYQYLVYDDARYHAIGTLVPDATERIVVVNGVAKTFAMTGWRVGWMIAPLPVARAAAKLMSHSTSNVANVSQRAAIAALRGPMDPVLEMHAAFDRRRRLAVERLRAIAGVTCITPRGAFYVFPSLEERLADPVAGRPVGSTSELAARLLDEAHVAVVPGEAFGAPGYLRLSYALGDDELEEGLDRIARYLG